MHVHSLAYSAPLPLPFEKEKEGDRANTERWFVFARRLPLLLLLLAVWLKRKAITELQQRRRRCLGTVSLSFSLCVCASIRCYVLDVRAASVCSYVCTFVSMVRAYIGRYTIHMWAHTLTQARILAHMHQEKTATMWFDVLTNNEEVGSPSSLLFAVVVVVAHCCWNEGRCV